MKLRVSHKIAIVMFFIEVLFGGILIFYMKYELNKIEELNYKALKNHYLEEIKIEKDLVNTLEMERFSNLINALQVPFSEMLFLMDEKGLKKSIQKILESPFVVGVKVCDSDLDRVFIFGYKEGDKNFFNQNKRDFKGADIKLLEKDLYILNKKIGEVKIFYTLTPVNKKIDEITSFQMKAFENHTKMLREKTKKTLFIAVSILGALIFFTLLVGYIVFYLLVSVRLEKLEDGLDKFFGFLKNSNSKVDKIEKIEIGPDDEICEMIDSINENIKEVETIHNNLSYFMKIIDEYVLYLEVGDDLRIKEISEAFSVLIGIPKSQVAGKRVGDIIKNSNVEKVFEKVREVGFVSIELKIQKDIYLDMFISYKSHLFTVLAHNITQERLLKRINSQLEDIVKEKTRELQESHETLQHMFKMVQDSIKYASIIQHSLLPKEDLIKKCVKDYFVIYHPKDIVGGDIYLFYNIDDDKCFILLIDGVGHGVPGAFSSMFAKAIEAHIFSSLENLSVTDVLKKSNEYINELANTKEIGFDMAVVFVDKKNKKLNFAGAREDLFIIKDGEVKVLKGDKFSIGFNQKIDREITEYEITYDEIEFYLTTDGFLDQIGGEKEFSFGKKRFVSILKEISHLDLQAQKEELFRRWYEYKGDNEQTDDVTVIGVKV